MKIEEMPPVRHEWPEHAKLTEPETDDMVKLVFGLTETHTDPYHPAVKSSEIHRDDGARLDNYESRRLNNLADIVRDLTKGVEGAKGASRGAKSINYDQAVMDCIADMIESGNRALDLIAAFEEGR